MTAPAVALARMTDMSQSEASEEADYTFDDNGIAIQEDSYAEYERLALAGLYGDDFPLVTGREDDDNEWVAWAKQLWWRRSASMTQLMHMVGRNRSMYDGDQWISAQLGQPWRKPPAPKGRVRAVQNMIKPALDMRLEVVADQRPGFRTRPTKPDTDALRKADAQQVSLEFHWEKQKMTQIVLEARRWAGTDGVAFWEVYWDPDAGPWTDSMMPMIGAGGVRSERSMRFRMGDLKTRVLRMEHVRVAPNASATVSPLYWITCEKISKAEAIAEHGIKVIERDSRGAGAGIDSDATADSSIATFSPTDNRYKTLTDPDRIIGDDETVDRYKVYLEPNDFLPGGLEVCIVGEAVVFPASQLTFGVVPMVRVPDGTTDTAFFPLPRMNDWIEDQMAFNAGLSRWIESIRRQAGGQIAMRGGSGISTETLVAGLSQVMELRGLPQSGSIRDHMEVMQNVGVGTDTRDFLVMKKQAFEEKSGWNDVTRGSFASGTSGRAILAIREQLERTFAMDVNAIANAATEWAGIVLHGQAWGYDLPRLIALTGSARPDLARELSSDDFNWIADVWIDPETLFPMPRALRLFMLQSAYQEGLIDKAEYRRRLPYATLQNIDSPDLDHYNRAQRICDAFRQIAKGVEVPVPAMKWQDDEAIHQDVLQRDLILDDDEHPLARQLAEQRWIELANQASLKAGVLGSMGMGGLPQLPSRTGGAGGGGLSEMMSPETQPLLNTNPGVASAPAEMLRPDGGRENSFDRTQLR